MEELYPDYEVLSVKEETSWLRRLELTPKVLIVHSMLMIATYFSMAFSYAVTGLAASWGDAFLFASLLMAFLASHEFGHYIASVKHGVKASLPYFIPLPLISPIGTMGAVIRVKEQISVTRKMFDVGIAGPLAGFVVALITLFVGFFTLPSPEFMLHFSGHEALNAHILEHGTFPISPPPSEEGSSLILGNTLLYSFIASFFSHVPPMYEMYHYPVLFAGWIGLFFTALNLIPVGQLDGGHIVYGLIGYNNHLKVARVTFALLLTIGGLGMLPNLAEVATELDLNSITFPWIVWSGIVFLMLYAAYRKDHTWIAPMWAGTLMATALFYYTLAQDTDVMGFTGWLVWAALILFIIKLEHPPVFFEQRLDARRKVLGWLAMVILLLCISPNPFTLK